jgi:AMP-polyphosphate phosphotransferase
MRHDLSKYEAGANFDGNYEEELTALQERLSRILVAHIVHQRRSMIVVEGWDAAGKGGAIKRMTADWDPRAFSVWPIKAPTEEEKQRHFLWRFWSKLPGAGQIAIFDRSWYGRVLVERVEGFAEAAAWCRGYEEINAFEAQQATDGITIVKLFFHVTQRVQDERFRERLRHPWKRWKVTPEDFRNRLRRKDYTLACSEMLDRTDTELAPWTVIDGNKKKPARIVALRAVADQLEAAVPMHPPEASEEVKELARRASFL